VPDVETSPLLGRLDVRRPKELPSWASEITTARNLLEAQIPAITVARQHDKCCQQKYAADD
jgi:hypothetical protein